MELHVATLLSAIARALHTRPGGPCTTRVPAMVATATLRSRCWSWSLASPLDLIYRYAFVIQVPRLCCAQQFAIAPWLRTKKARQGCRSRQAFRRPSVEPFFLGGLAVDRPWR